MKTSIEREAIAMGFDLKAAEILRKAESTRRHITEEAARRIEEHHAMHNETPGHEFSASAPKD